MHDVQPGAGHTAAAAMARIATRVAAGGPPRVVDRGKAGEQVWRVGWPERVGVGELGQGGRDRG